MSARSCSRWPVGEALTLHEDPRSGNCYKIRLTAALLGLPLSVRGYDIMKGETRTPEFLGTVNANGRIPVLQIGEGEGARRFPTPRTASGGVSSPGAEGERRRRRSAFESSRG